MRSWAAGRRGRCDPPRRRAIGPCAFRVGSVLLTLSLPAALFGQGAPPPSFEHEVEASFVYTVSKFVDWPASAFREPSSPLVFVVLGDDPVEASLTRAVAGKTVDGHPIEVIRVASEDRLVPCHVLFIGRTEAARVDDVIARLQGSSVLTVADFERFAQRGGILKLTLDQAMVRFEVNVDAAERAGLQISSKILKLGKVVHDRRRGARIP